MSLHNTPEQHDADPPAKWQVVKTGSRSWELRSSLHQDGDGALSYRPTRKAAEEDKTCGHLVNMYEREGRWFRGEPVAGWKPYAVIVAERERHAAWLASKRAS